MRKLLIFGMGYVGQHLTDALVEQFEVVGVSRDWSGVEELDSADAVLMSIPPSDKGDVVYEKFGQLIENSNVKWLGYLSTTGVYGDHQGGFVDETTHTAAQSLRAKWRVLAENQWSGCSIDSVNIFRLPGIYGLGRSAFDALNQGRARRVDVRLENNDKQFFCRAHVDDIAQVLKASLLGGLRGVNIYNIADDLPAPNADIIEFAAQIMGVAVPKLVAEDKAGMSEMAQSFYAECKYIKNDKIKNELGIELKHPNYKQGLRAIWQQMQN